MNETKNNHYVPKKYLRSFHNDTQNCIYRYDKISKKIILGGGELYNIGAEKDLYTVKSKITKDEVAFFKKLWKMYSRETEDNHILGLLTDYMNGTCEKFFDIKNYQGLSHETAQLMSDFIYKYFRNDGMARTQENLCSFYERDFFRVYDNILDTQSLDCLYPIAGGFLNLRTLIYDKLRVVIQQYPLARFRAYIKEGLKGNIANEKLLEELKKIKLLDCLEEKRSPYFDLFFYIIFQYFRCPWFLNILFGDERVSQLKTKLGISFENVQFLFLQYATIHLLPNWHKCGMKPVLIKNKTDIPFLTSDRPSINIYCKLIRDIDMYNIDAPETFELYFPLSKNVAILYSLKECYGATNEIVVTSQNDIMLYNKQIFDNAEKYVFSSIDNFAEYE